MFIEVVKSKIHKATVTEANLQYVGSITIDVALMEAANIIENEMCSRRCGHHYFLCIDGLRRS